MAPRDLIALRLDRETPETLRSALQALDDITPNPMPERHAKKFAEIREEFLQELRTMEADTPQGALF